MKGNHLPPRAMLHNCAQISCSRTALRWGAKQTRAPRRMRNIVSHCSPPRFRFLRGISVDARVCVCVCV